MNQENKNVIRIHRVGSITAGFSMIVWGIMFILHEINIIADVALILKLWPLILVGLGIEILWFNARDKNIVYDKGAVFLMVIMTCFSMIMAIADVCMNYVTTYGV